MKKRADTNQITCIARYPGDSLFDHLRKCTQTKDLSAGRVCYDHLVRIQLERLSFWSDQLIRLFAASGKLSDSNQVFDRVLSPTIFTWNAIISAHVRSDDLHSAVKLYQSMQLNCVQPDRVTFLCMLKVCIGLSDPFQGQMMHVQTSEHGFGADHIIGNALIDMYSKVGALSEAHRVFDAMTFHDKVSWGALIAGYAHQGHAYLALDLYECMQRDGIGHDRVILLCVARAISDIQAITQGRVLHNDAVKDEFESDVVLGSALIGMYAKCDSMKEAKSLFDRLPKRNVVSWGALIGGFSNQGHDATVCHLYERMKQEGIQADRVILLCVLKACGGLGALWQGRLIDDLLRRRCIEIDVVLGSALVEMYVRCGSADDAQRVLVGIDSPNTILWGMLIGGYAICGNEEMVEKCLATMQRQGLTADHMLITQVLASCKHSGLLDNGYRCFNSMIASVSSTEHYTCMVDLFGRVGHLDAATNLVKTMPLPPDKIAWRSLLTGCKIHSNANLGQECSDREL